MKISAIVCMGKNRVIGKENKLLWKVPSETQHYLNLRAQHWYLIGRKNYEGSLQVQNLERAIVLTTNPEYQCSARSFTDVDNAIRFAEEQGEMELFVIGGEQIYRELMPRLDYLHLSIIDTEEEGDTYFPEHEQFNWRVITQTQRQKDEQTPLAWSYQKLQRIS